MASGKGLSWSNKALDSVLGAVAFTAPANVFIALYTVAPTSASGSGTEVSAGGYARVSVANTLANWPAASAGSKSNANIVSFPTATANWGTVLAFAIYDAVTAGNELYFGTLTASVSVSTGGTPQFAAGTLVVTES